MQTSAKSRGSIERQSRLFRRTRNRQKNTGLGKFFAAPLRKPASGPESSGLPFPFVCSCILSRDRHHFFPDAALAS
jgi:hypothetical protein